MMDETSYAFEQGSAAAGRALLGTKLDETTQRIALEAAQTGIRAALAIYSKHIQQTMHQNGQIMTDVEREALQVLYKAVGILKGAQ